MNIVITGGTGLIGRHLIPRLLELGHQITVMTRNPQKASSVLGPRVTLWQGLADQSNLNGVDAVINPAGEPIADKRWTHEQKERLCQSRWNITQKLVDLINASDTPPSVLISGSATGYYGDLGEVVVTEEEPPHNEFTHKLCARWEEIACRAQSDKTRVCLLRTGVVLAPDGGILGKMLPPFRLGPGGPIFWVFLCLGLRCVFAVEKPPTAHQRRGRVAPRRRRVVAVTVAGGIHHVSVYRRCGKHRGADRQKRHHAHEQGQECRKGFLERFTFHRSFTSCFLQQRSAPFPMRFSLRDVVWLRCSRYTDRITLLFSAAPKRRNI